MYVCIYRKIITLNTCPGNRFSFISKEPTVLFGGLSSENPKDRLEEVLCRMSGNPSGSPEPLFSLSSLSGLGAGC